MSIYRFYVCSFWKASENCIKSPRFISVRWRKEIKRKPMWMPTAKSKFYRIPEHPYVSPEEKDLCSELLDEYKIKYESMRKLFQEEMKQKFEDEGNTLIKQKESEEQFRLLLEENKKENERIRMIREETLETILQQKEIELLQLEELRKSEQEQVKLKVEAIIRSEKEKDAAHINYDNLEAAIEKAMENPINYSFAINMSGSLKWEGKPPLHFEEDMKRRMLESIAEN